MIKLYTWTTPNGRKASIALEEMGLEYVAIPVDIEKNEQFAPDFLKISPNNKIPAIVDEDTGQALMESGAILLYLAEKTGRFLPNDADAKRYDLLQWLFWQTSSQGPMLGQAHHFLQYRPGVSSYAEQRYHTEAQRLYGILDRRLSDRDYVCGTYSIADMATWPWVSRFEYQRIDLREYPNVLRWYRSIAKRPAVQRGYRVPRDVGAIPQPADQ
ncbi:GST-like protein [Aminobacter lissarensis]|uniref:GST-like protein n=1 Tax=Aminobacter carboxidus TaxID=376165 RepID=A0A8E2BF76_9HYPH|nr:glutathione S-transferase N-terminal domain-containing protein [Aminobacter lissarensis]MBB6469119.1 GST-like protein [Aminobacter lissarensis]